MARGSRIEPCEWGGFHTWCGVHAMEPMHVLPHATASNVLFEAHAVSNVSQSEIKRPSYMESKTRERGSKGGAALVQKRRRSTQHVRLFNGGACRLL